MNATKELRAIAAKTECANGRCEKLYRGDLDNIADRIDEEHQKALDEWKAEHGQMWLKGYSECHAELLEGNETLASDLERCGWIRLPKDADGEPIHIGDEVYQVEGGWVYTVESITIRPDNTTVTFSCKHGFGCDSAHNVRHYHKPTVEDVLEEFLDAYQQYEGDGYDVVAEYAAKLRLAEEDA